MKCSGWNEYIPPTIKPVENEVEEVGIFFGVLFDGNFYFYNYKKSCKGKRELLAVAME